MNPLDFIDDYLYDNQEGLHNLLVWFLTYVKEVHTKKTLISTLDGRPLPFQTPSRECA